MRIVRRFGFLVDFLYPQRCLVCGKAGGGWVHSHCREMLPYLSGPVCRVCGLPLSPGENCKSAICRMPARPFDRVRSVFVHKDSARQAVLKLKYQGVYSLAEFLGEEMARAARNYGLSNADLVVPVPLHNLRQRDRGYNQAELLAKSLGHQAGLAVQAGLLVRNRQTRTQVGLNLSQRAQNVAGAFSWAGTPLSGQAILLVDDVCTTGATLAESARALKEAGADRVDALTLTREFFQPNQTGR